MIALSGHGYPPTTDGLAVALEDLVEADQIIAALLAEPDSTRVLQRASAHLERARWRRSGGQGDAAPVLRSHTLFCPQCGAGVKWSCNDTSEGGTGYAHCQDGRNVSRRLPGIGEPCDWMGARVVRRNGLVVADESDLRWLTQPPAATSAATSAGGTGGNSAGLRDLAAREAGSTMGATASQTPRGQFATVAGPTGQAVRRNCWSCRWASPDTRMCMRINDTDDVEEWINRTHPLADMPCACPPAAAGCPGWAAREVSGG